MRDRVDYDAIALTYDRRYAVNEYGGVLDALTRFVAPRTPAPTVGQPDFLEVGCGTGHWVAALRPAVRRCAGVDPSREMLARARAAAADAWLVQARAEALPWRSATFDRLIVVNAVHHFGDVERFIAEAKRVLRPAGGVITIGLDPHTGADRWWIYEYFPSAESADRARYPAAAWLRAQLAAAGFEDCRTEMAQHWPAAVSAADAEAQGMLERTSTSQLLVIPDAEYAAGVARIRALARHSREPALLLRADLRLYATSAWLPA
jgi:ubiquinone/menaquinone biosynthesis C-methylase UbiE